MTEMFGEAWSPMSVPDLAPDDDDDVVNIEIKRTHAVSKKFPVGDFLRMPIQILALLLELD